MRLDRFFGDREGGVAPLLALAAVPLVTAVGASVDYSRGNAARTAMQSALDAAVIMMAKDSQQPGNNQFVGNASTYFSANFSRTDVQNVQVNVATAAVPGGTSVNLTATGAISTLFMRLIGLSTLNLSVSSGVYAAGDGLGCVLSLDHAASGAATAQGTTSVNLNGCSLYDNSNSATALTVGGSASLSALSIGVVGGISGNAGIMTNQSVRTGIGPVIDPYANDSFPNFFGCSKENYSAKSTETIDSGVYCGGMQLNAGANVTLNPGIYYLDGGGLSVNGGATLSGSGVTLVFTKKSEKNWPTATINGNATINLTAPKSGATAGIVVFGDRNIPLGTTFKFNGGATQYFGGAVYIPTGAINFAGGAGSSSNCTQVIGDTVTFVGNSALALNCSNYEVKPFSALLIKLTL